MFEEQGVAVLQLRTAYFRVVRSLDVDSVRAYREYCRVVDRCRLLGVLE